MALLTSTLANLDMMRERLFSLDEPVHLSAEQKEAYWPYVSNIWCRKDKMITPHGAVSKELWRCRRSRSSRPKEKVDGVKHRKRSAFKADCACFMVVTHWQNGFWTFQRRTKSHSHTLQEADQKKKNLALQEAALEFIRKHGDIMKIAQRKANKMGAAQAAGEPSNQSEQGAVAETGDAATANPTAEEADDGEEGDDADDMDDDSDT